MVKCPLNHLVELPETDSPIPPNILAAIDIHNLMILNECVGRQSILIDVIADVNKKRL